MSLVNKKHKRDNECNTFFVLNMKNNKKENAIEY